jgi:hypothetical protein
MFISLLTAPHPCNQHTTERCLPFTPTTPSTYLQENNAHGNDGERFQNNRTGKVFLECSKLSTVFFMPHCVTLPPKQADE